MAWFSQHSKQVRRLWRLISFVFFFGSFSFLLLVFYLVSVNSPKPHATTSIRPHERVISLTSQRERKRILRYWKKSYKSSVMVVKDATKIPLPTTTSWLSLPDNYNLKRHFCNVKNRNTFLCPTLYTELGGKCMYKESKADCIDVRQFGSYNLRKAQLAITRLVGLFDLVTRRHNITYWLSSGTLLGAVRHKGFIPWDEDADVEMTLDEYEKFYRYASKDLPHDVFFQNSESDPFLRPSDPKEYEREKYKDIGLYKRFENPRLRDRKSCYKYCINYDCKWHDGLMVDIFVHENLPNGTYPIKEYLFEGLRLHVASNWKQDLINKYGDNYMDIPKKGSESREVSVDLDPFHSCEEIMRVRRRLARRKKRKKPRSKKRKIPGFN